MTPAQWTGTAAALLLLAACSPKVKEFDVSPRSLCAGQGARVTWSGRGTPTVLLQLSGPRLHVDADLDDPETRTAPDTIEVTIVLTERGKEAIQHLDIEQYPESADGEVVFPTTREGDTLVARGVKNPTRWGQAFVVAGVGSLSSRPVEVMHVGRRVSIPAGGPLSPAFDGAPVEGSWELRTTMTPAERADPTRAPGTLQLPLHFACRRTTS